MCKTMALVGTLAVVAAVPGAQASGTAVSVLIVVPPYAGEPEVAFARELEHAIGREHHAFTLTRSPFAADVTVKLESVGPAGYRAGREPGSRESIGCSVSAQVASKRALPITIGHYDSNCSQAARGLLLGITRHLSRAHQTDAI